MSSVKRALKLARKARNRKAKEELLLLPGLPKRDTLTFCGKHRGGTELKIQFSGSPVPLTN